MFNVRTNFGKMANAFSVPMSWFRKVGNYCKTLTIEVRGGEQNGITAFVMKPDEPSEQEPVTIVLDVTALQAGGGGAELGNTIPLADSGTGEAGNAQLASRENHRHPLNVDTTTPEAVAASGSAGSASTYSRRDHTHADKPPVNEASKVTLAGSGVTANNVAWASNGVTGAVLRVQTRTVYDTSTSQPQLYGYYIDIILDRAGRVYSASAEQRHIIATPEANY